MDVSGANASDALLGSNATFSVPHDALAQSLVTVYNTLPNRRPILRQLRFGVSGTERVQVDVYSTAGVKLYRKWVSIENWSLGL